MTVPTKTCIFSKPLFYIVDTDNPSLLGLVSRFKDVFTVMGLFPGDCTIHLKPDAVPVVHPPWKISVSVREPFTANLKRMEDSDMIANVKEATDLLPRHKAIYLSWFRPELFCLLLGPPGSTVGFILLQCSSGVVRHPRDLQVLVATRSCRVLIFASS